MTPRRPKNDPKAHVDSDIQQMKAIIDQAKADMSTMKVIMDSVSSWQKQMEAKITMQTDAMTVLSTQVAGLTANYVEIVASMKKILEKLNTA